MSENFVPQVRMGRRTAQTSLYIGDAMKVEVGKHQRILFVETLLVEYELDPAIGYWKWTAATLYGAWGDGRPGHTTFKYQAAETPFWVVALIHRHVPEYRKTRES